MSELTTLLDLQRHSGGCKSRFVVMEGPFQCNCWRGQAIRLAEELSRQLAHALNQVQYLDTALAAVTERAEAAEGKLAVACSEATLLADLWGSGIYDCEAAIQRIVLATETDVTK